MKTVFQNRYNSIADQELDELRSEIEPRNIELKKTEVDTRVDN